VLFSGILPCYERKKIWYNWGEGGSSRKKSRKTAKGEVMGAREEFPLLQSFSSSSGDLLRNELSVEMGAKKAEKN